MNRLEYSICFAVVFSAFCLSTGTLNAQYKDRFRRQIVVGDLVGKTDYRELKILTKQGLLTVRGEGNGKPFSVLNLSPKRVILQFYRSTGLGNFNPNTVIIKFYQTERALISALILEEVDVAVLENEVSALEVAKSNTNIVPLPIPMEQNTVKMLLYNHRRKIFASAKTRQAISYGINHDYIIKKIIKDSKANLARGPFDDDSPFYNPGMKSYKYNPRLALNILVHTGWRDLNGDGVIEKNGTPFIMNLYYQKGVRLDEAISRSIKIDLIKLGIDVQPRPLTKRQINQKLKSGDYDSILLEQVFKDSAVSLKDFFSVNGSQNFMSYHSSTFERYYRFYLSAKSSSQKKTLIKSMQNVINTDQPATFLYFKWLTHYLVNVERFANFRYTEGPNSGKIRPYEEWIFKSPDN